MLGQCGRQSGNHTFGSGDYTPTQPDLHPHSPPAPIANLAAPKVITSSMALISFGHCSHQRFNESVIMGNTPASGAIKGNPQ